MYTTAFVSIDDDVNYQIRYYSVYGNCSRTTSVEEPGLEEHPETSTISTRAPRHSMSPAETHGRQQRTDTAGGRHLDDLQHGVGARVAGAHQRVPLSPQPRAEAQRLHRPPPSTRPLTRSSSTALPDAGQHTQHRALPTPSQRWAAGGESARQRRSGGDVTAATKTVSRWQEACRARVRAPPQGHNHVTPHTATLDSAERRRRRWSAPAAGAAPPTAHARRRRCSTPCGTPTAAAAPAPPPPSAHTCAAEQRANDVLLHTVFPNTPPSSEQSRPRVLSIAVCKV